MYKVLSLAIALSYSCESQSYLFSDKCTLSDINNEKVSFNEISLQAKPEFQRFFPKSKDIKFRDLETIVLDYIDLIKKNSSSTLDSAIAKITIIRKELNTLIDNVIDRVVDREVKKSTKINWRYIITSIGKLMACCLFSTFLLYIVFPCFRSPSIPQHKVYDIMNFGNKSLFMVSGD